MEQYNPFADIEKFPDTPKDSSDNTSEQTMYGSFDKPESESNEISKNIIEAPENIQSIPEFKIIEGLIKNGHITEEQFQEVVEKLSKSDKSDTDKIILNFISNNVANSELQNTLTQTIEGGKDINEDNFEQSEFYKASRSESMQIDYSVGNLEILLAENYVEIPNIEAEESNSKVEAINRSMDITLDKLIMNNSDTFKKNNAELISEIKAEKSLDSKYKKLKKLHRKHLEDGGIKGGSKSKDCTRLARIKKDSIEKRLKELNEFCKVDGSEEQVKQTEEIKKTLEDELGVSNEMFKTIYSEISKTKGVIEGGEIDNTPESTEK